MFKFSEINTKEEITMQYKTNPKFYFVRAEFKHTHKHTIHTQTQFRSPSYSRHWLDNNIPSAIRMQVKTQNTQKYSQIPKTLKL